MTATPLDALGTLRFNWTQTADDVWRLSQIHVQGMHRATVHMLREGFADARDSDDASPIGVILQGQRGTGKTHLLGWVREEILGEEGYFFLVGLLDAKSFWQSIVVSMLDSFARTGVDGWSQLKLLLWRLCSRAEVPDDVRRAVIGDAELTKDTLDAFVDALRRTDRLVGRQVQDVARALVMLAADDLAAQDIGETFLFCAPEEEAGERARWGIRKIDRTSQEIVRDISRLLALTGPSVIAIDQIDALIAQSSAGTDTGAAQSRNASEVLEQIAGGLMALREITRRTLTVVSCLPHTWVLIHDLATDSVRDRFRVADQLKTIPDAETGRALIEKRFAVPYHLTGFKPPYPTWPVKASAFDRAPEFTPRQLLIKIDGHIRSCLLDERITELEHLVGSPTARPAPQPNSAEGLAAIDARFAELRGAAKVPVIDGFNEDATMPALLSAGLAAWIAEQGEAGRPFSQDPPPSAKPSLHARLRRTLDETSEDEIHWAFRAVTADNANAALNRLRKAEVAAGLDAAAPKRRLYLLRNADWAKGPRTQEKIAEFEQAGGRILPVSDDDLTTLAALELLLAENPADLPAWLAARRPTSKIAFLSEALREVWTVPPHNHLPHR